MKCSIDNRLRSLCGTDKYGHVSRRATSDGSCQKCRAENQKAERAKRKMIRNIRIAKAYK